MRIKGSSTLRRDALRRGDDEGDVEVGGGIRERRHPRPRGLDDAVDRHGDPLAVVADVPGNFRIGSRSLFSSTIGC